MKKSFWGLVWSNFLRIQGVLLSAIGIALWFFTPQTSISLGLVLLVVILALVITLTFASTAYELFNKSKDFFSLPRVIFTRKIVANNQRQFLIFLLESSELFSNDTLVSFYYFDDDFEQLIAIGRVINIQQNSKIQVEVIYPLSGHEEIFKRLENNDANALKKTRVKPNIPKAFLDGKL
jgi:hypothetical protein